MPAVSLSATLVATVLGLVLGALWYGPLFGRRWAAAVGMTGGMTAAQIRPGFNPTRIYGATIGLGLVASYVFGLYLGPSPGRAFSIVAGAAVGVCWVATALATNYLFEGKPAVLIAINGGYHAVRFTLIGLAFGLLG